MTFIDIWHSSEKLSPGEQQKWLRQEIPKRLLASGARLARKGPGAPDRVVVGIAEYSREDLQLLDSVCAAASAQGVLLEVFILTECRSQREIEEYVPGVGPVFQSPVAGVWTAGSLRESGSGYVARALLRTALRLP